MRRTIAALTTILGLLAPGLVAAATIYPIDRAEILAGSRFDLKVEFDGVIAEGDARVTVNGKDHAALFGRAAQFSRAGSAGRGLGPDPSRRDAGRPGTTPSPRPTARSRGR